jgi:predicted DNA-binding transcriptional regulator AlpA
MSRPVRRRPGPRLQEHVERLLEGLPDDTMVGLPAAWVRRLLESDSATGLHEEALLTVRGLAHRYGCAESTVRAWCAAGKFPGAYKLYGKAWRVPASAVRAFDERQAEPSSPQSALGERHPADLGAWRRHLP